MKTLVGILTLLMVVTACKMRSTASKVRAFDPSAFSKNDYDTLQKFFQSHCVECHSEGGEGGFSTADNVPKLAESPIVLKGNPDSSRLWQRLAAKTMPPTEASSFPSEDEKQIVQRWIAAGAPLTFGGDANSRKFLSAGSMLDAIAADLASLPAGDRPFTRYLTIRNLYNQRAGGVSLIKDEQLLAFRNGLSFLVNSLHWRKEVSPLAAVAGSDGTVLRLDLRKYSSTVGELDKLGIRGLATTSNAWTYDQGYGLTTSAWDSLIANDPYKVAYQGEAADAIRTQTGTLFPFMRGDIFVFLSSRSHNGDKPETFKFSYYRILGIDGNFENTNKAIFGRTIEDQLRRGDTNVVRSGFADSGVSDHNRLLERHKIPAYKADGGREAAYWLSYDFGGSVGNQHLESHPLGPRSAFGDIAGGRHAFSHDGGEVIFSLPNGLHAYMLFTAAGKLLDEGPINIVRDKKRAVVLNGISWMDCHKLGMIPKPDTVRFHIDENRAQYAEEEFAILKRLYRQDPVVLTTQFEYDTSTYLHAKAKTKVDADQFNDEQAYNEAIALGIPDMHDLFVTDVTVAVAASEVDIDEAAFKASLESTPELRKILAAFLTGGKIVKRETFREFFPKIVSGLNLDRVAPNEERGNLCDGCSVVCKAQVFTIQNTVLSSSSFEGESTQSEPAARESALQRCNDRLTDGLRASGYHCKVVNECTVKSN